MIKSKNAMALTLLIGMQFAFGSSNASAQEAPARAPEAPKKALPPSPAAVPAPPATPVAPLPAIPPAAPAVPRAPAALRAPIDIETPVVNEKEQVPAASEDAAIEETFEQYDSPVVINSPTGYLIQAGKVHSRVGVDTSGGLSGTVAFGLGDVADFSLSTTDLLKYRTLEDDDSQRLAPYFTAAFRVGVAEDRLFDNQPGLVLGFRKSFEQEHHGHDTQIAQLYLVASKRIGNSVKLHAGATLWDASVKQQENVVFLHDEGLKNMLRPFGSIEIAALPRSDILVEFDWTPEFVYATKKTELNAMLAWGVRYQAVDWLDVQSGVRVPKIQSGSLLDAQIFVQFDIKSNPFEKFIEIKEARDKELEANSGSLY